MCYPHVCKAFAFSHQGQFDKAMATLDHFKYVVDDLPDGLRSRKPSNLQQCENFIRYAEVSALFVVVLLINITSLARASLIRGNILDYQGEKEARIEHYLRALERYLTVVDGKRHPWIADVQIKIASLLHQSVKPEGLRFVLIMPTFVLNLHLLPQIIHTRCHRDLPNVRRTRPSCKSTLRRRGEARLPFLS